MQKRLGRTFAELAADLTVAISVIESRIGQSEDLARQWGLPKPSTDLALAPLRQACTGVGEARELLKALAEFEPEMRDLLAQWAPAAPPVPVDAQLMAGAAT